MAGVVGLVVPAALSGRRAQSKLLASESRTRHHRLVGGISRDWWRGQGSFPSMRFVQVLDRQTTALVYACHNS